MISGTTGQFRPGVRIGIDVGSVRIGVSRTDPDAVLAVPVTTVARPRRGSTPRTDLSELATIVAEYAPLELVVGLPVTLDGQEGPAVAAVRDYVAELLAELEERHLDVPVRLVDERLSTAVASRQLRAAGRDTRSGRAVIDQAAAVVIVQDTIDFERATGRAPGTVVSHAAPQRTRTAPDRDRDDHS
ncbi:MAG TPA: Holliday junction resolvase RuvX [Candidatus Nanopelagicales bacterium]